MGISASNLSRYQGAGQRDDGGNALSGETARESVPSVLSPDRLEAAKVRLTPDTVSFIENSHTRGAVPHLQDLARVDNGFTLIELLIVIVVLGILAAVVIFALGGITGKSAVAACQADGATVSTAIAALNTEYPGALVATGTGASAEEALMTGSASGGPYVSSWPSNPGHYALALYSGVLGIEIPGPSAGTAWIPTATFSTAATYTSSTAAAGTGFIYSGPSACANVK
jgi:general secretion pathway protein G